MYLQLYPYQIQKKNKSSSSDLYFKDLSASNYNLSRKRHSFRKKLFPSGGHVVLTRHSSRGIRCIIMLFYEKETCLPMRNWKQRQQDAEKIREERLFPYEKYLYLNKYPFICHCNLYVCNFIRVLIKLLDHLTSKARSHCVSFEWILHKYLDKFKYNYKRKILIIVIIEIYQHHCCFYVKFEAIRDHRTLKLAISY